jgi:phosphatidylserine decarboxylase
MDPYSWSEPPGQMTLPVAKAGYPLIFGAAFVTLIFALLGMTYLTLMGLVITLCFCGFFRDPDRVVPNRPEAVVSPADGKVISVSDVGDTPFYEGRCKKISIFMSVFNVHVNRIPYGGSIRKVNYYPGKFFAANLDKASLQNEHNAIYLETADAQHLCVVQIAGLIARRIICKVQAGNEVLKGQRYGIICFGSRIDLYLPINAKTDVAIGDKVKAGSSIIGRLAKS